MKHDRRSVIRGNAMPIFQYNGYKPDGSHIMGTIEADGLPSAIASVKSLGIYPKEVFESIRGEKRWFFRRSDHAFLPYITRQLSTLISSGVPLVEALKSLSEENRGPWKGILVNVRERVSGGASLSRALEGHPKIFPEFYLHMVGAGEQSGTLDRVLVRLADFLEEQAGIRARIRVAMIYPTFMVCIGFVVMALLFTFVIPKIVKIFENTGSALPLMTVVLICISHLFLNYWWAILSVLAGFVLGMRRFQESHRYFVDKIKLNTPGHIIQSLYFSRFTRTLGFLLEGGLPMLKALDLSAKSIGNLVLKNRIVDAVKRVAEGGRLSASLHGFPPVLLQLISTGEKSGRLVEVLNKAADSYEEEFGRRVQKALSLLEPVMILVMGLMVGFIVLAVLLPMFELNQLVR